MSVVMRNTVAWDNLSKWDAETSGNRRLVFLPWAEGKEVDIILCSVISTLTPRSMPILQGETGNEAFPLELAATTPKDP